MVGKNKKKTQESTDSALDKDWGAFAEPDAVGKGSAVSSDSFGREAAAASTANDTDAARVLHLKLETLEKALNTERAASAEHKDKVVRLHAELDNMRRRNKLDLEKAHKYGLEKVGRDLIEIVDNLERALAAFDAGEDKSTASVEELAKGIHFTLSHFLEILKKHGIEPIDPTGETFNPEFHEAVSVQPDEKNPPNTVLQLMQKGYLINGRLLRAARVIVSAS